MKNFIFGTFVGLVLGILISFTFNIPSVCEKEVTDSTKVECVQVIDSISEFDEDTTAVFGVSYMKFTMNRMLGKSQVDSMIRVDKLGPLDSWIQSYLPGKFNSKVQYLYIKSLKQNDELIYTVTQTDNDTIFKCVKRITEER